MKRGPSDNPYWDQLDPALRYKMQGAIWKAPKPLYVPRREDYRNTPKAFGDPTKPGYGGDEWPFNLQRAYKYPSFRTALRKAIAADWTDGHWKFMAMRALLAVLEDLILADVIGEDLATCLNE